MLKKFVFIVVFLISCGGFATSQKANPKGFEKTIKTFNVLLFNQNFEEAYQLLESKSLQLNTLDIETRTQLYFLYSKYYLFTEDLDKGKAYAEKAYHISLESEKPLAQAYGLYAMAYYYQQLDLNQMAFDNIQKIMNVIDIEEYPYFAYKIYYKLYGIYATWDDPEQTNNFAQKAVKFALEIEDYDALSNAYSAKATAMENMFELSKNTAYQDSILYYLQKSVSIEATQGHQLTDITKIIAKLNLANHYFQILRNDEMQNEAAKDSINKYLNTIGTIPPEIDKNYELRASVLGLKSQIALSNGDIDEAEKLLLNAYENLRTDGIRPAYYKLYNVSIGLYELFKIKGDYKKAFEYLQQNQIFKDSIFNENKIHEVHSLEAKYENARFKEEITFLEEQSRFRKIQNYLLIGICILILATLYLIIKNYQRKIALQKEKAFALKKEKAEAEAQVSLEREKQARLSAERTILKLNNEKMQKEVMMNTLQIKRKNELLQEFKEQFMKSDNSIDATKVLKQEKRIEKSLNDTVKEFEDVHPKFFMKLKEQSNHKLTALDQKYAAYFHLGLSTKEIAQIFNVEPKSIRMTKYRIKQKLNLPKDQTIEEFFETISND